ncbi:undecaprenyl-diphosphatase [Alkalibacillus filiformis]|uniref:Undecaprenyl-diphosphatase n=1 Tax=Alkalibacillus filiformis TaxID=200990 RepID=A0ABU0DWY9_9BACI|nr:phosphatase PAP2 family protein [Alkalibacillus filiformis]MDQ0352988.1 undecaprenyl-diphosphatase [Alkalibacillus filiformis]
MKNRMSIYIAVALLSLFSFIALSISVINQEQTWLDRQIADVLSPLQDTAFMSSMDLISNLGSTELLAVLSLLTIAVLWFKQKSLKHIILFIAVMGGGVLLNLLFKFSFERGRPDDQHHIEAFGVNLELVSYSFPSGHSTRAFLFFAFLIYIACMFINHRVAKGAIITALTIVIFAIGVSRIMLDAHFATDVLGAYSVSLAWLMLCVIVFEQTMKNRKNRAFG